MGQPFNATTRDFFQAAMQLALGNPYSGEQQQLEARLSGVIKGEDASRKGRSALAAVLDAQLDGLQLNEASSLESFASADRTLLENALALRCYMQVSPQIDAHILAQLRHDTVQPALWARDALRKLTTIGLSAEQSQRYVEIYFQLRRALYFIDAEITGACPAVIQLRIRLWNTLFTIEPQWYLKYLCGRMQDFSTLLLGETGTGKSAAARVIACSGYIPFEVATNRFTENFARAYLAINLAEYPASLVESQLFGHRKGAFTGATDHHQGLFARCSPHGTVFIDEIGDVDRSTQTKLLRVLQEREFTPVGGHEQLRFQGRIVAATNRDLDALRGAGEFRDDFYYRLCSDVIVVPPLRQRIEENPEELDLIVQTLIRRAIGEHTEPLAQRVVERIRAVLPSDYVWPGNVRELEQCVRRICITGEYPGDSKHLPGGPGLAQLIENGNLSADELLASYCRHLYRRLGTFEAVAQTAGLDRRTVKKYMERTGQ